MKQKKDDNHTTEDTTNGNLRHCIFEIITH